MSIDEVLATTQRGRALVQPRRGRDASTSSMARERTPSIQYREDARRQREREEAREVRRAMEELDGNDENRIYTAARDEAAELVWKHRNPNAKENEPHAPYAYPGLGKSSSQGRSRSLPRGDEDLQRKNSKLRKRSSMGSSTGSSMAGSRSSSLQSHRTPSGSSVTANAGFSTSPIKDSFFPGDKKQGSEVTVSKTASNPADVPQRRQSSGSRRKVSASLLNDPNDKIYEEPEEEYTASAPASTGVVAPTPAPAPASALSPAEPSTLNKLPLSIRRNPFSRVQFAKGNLLGRSNTDPTMGMKQRFDRVEIQNNPPTQSRNAAYTTNAAAPTKPKPNANSESDIENEPEVKMKDGKEIRSEELRAATGFKLKDRSPKLPTPTVVSDSPGRPIVSFQKDWKPKEVELKQEISLVDAKPKPVDESPSQPRPLAKNVPAPPIPTIDVHEESPQKEGTATAPSKPSMVSGPKSPFARRAQAPAAKVSGEPAAGPLSSIGMSRKVNSPEPSSAAVPTISVSQAPSSGSRPSPMPPVPTISVNEPASIRVTPSSSGAAVTPPPISVPPSIPTISVNEPAAPAPKMNTPSISVTPSIPTINVNGPGASSRPLPTPTRSAGRGSAKSLYGNGTLNNQSHWTPTSVRSGALCTHCALPISGRIVSAAGCRFHPECFRCHHCGEHLECVAFYPEPDSKYAERVARIRARMRGEDIECLPTHPTHEDMVRLEQEDGDESPRFFCHLDYHELFSPRCKSCKTPIEGEVVVACGAEWHVGHFFCAQCGDPFDSTTPFVEKDGYAWCVGCHTNRYSPKCRKCKKPVTDMVVKALGAEWHVGCFCCVECSGAFDDGRYFLRGESQDPVCVKCEERRLKA
ncbi:uncharacterized protein EI97DRAFT_436831 [Westerdykella ornata]|uniref:LIM zinc-binding domain-containing protein n=1 Tax=Westerdykella ornata TaxID=318751 RepID=A0A6A6JBM7_WESOR|nr:uncharacterized protein EI97DRAFT_436831 [Westerdykella ornata]KAF2272589.1 hypothetical protein EI97DRAFT_436831 [Westerdykella ornata]